MISIKNVSKAYKTQLLFDNISLNLNFGERILIKGVNGSGKSVLLKLIVGYSQPDQGSIEIDGVSYGKDFDFLPNSGVSINEPDFLPQLSGLDNLLYLANIRKIATKESILELADRFDLKKDIHKKYRHYSMGMRQKMRLIQALMDEPDYLILDEPFNALDQTATKITSKMLDEYVNKDRIMVYTDHTSEHDNLANRIYRIDSKELIEEKII